MRIYVDFDDVLCETACALADLSGRLFGRRVAYEAIHAFDLRVAFGLDAAQYGLLMDRAHEPEFLAGLAAVTDGPATLRRWAGEGHDTIVVTGRPFACRDASLAWLRAADLDGVPLLHVDKYGREPAAHGPRHSRALTVGELHLEPFDVAIEDAPSALDLLLLRAGCRAAVFDRPWNRSYRPARGVVTRCHGWRALDAWVRDGTLSPPRRDCGR
jgi:hypothetical protein